MRKRGLRWPFIYAFLLALSAANFAFASCPLLTHTDPDIEREFENVCQGIANPAIHYTTISTTTISSATITNLTVGTLTTTSTLGKIKQIVSTTSVTNFQTTSATFQNTNLIGSITPTSASSNILILVTSNLRTGAAATTANATIARGATNLAGSNGICKNRAASSTGVLDAPCAMMIYDSPLTSSATTYFVQLKSDGVTNAEWPSETTTLTQSMVMIEVGQ